MKRGRITPQFQSTCGHMGIAIELVVVETHNKATIIERIHFNPQTETDIYAENQILRIHS
jgi:hypothetical protein